MTLAAVGLVLTSAVMHAGWNAYSKYSGPSAAFFFLLSAFTAAGVAPIIFLHRGYVAEIPGTVVLMLLATGFFQATYFIGLGGAYRYGHISIAYPLARALPVVGVALGVVLLGRGGTFTFPVLGGFSLVVFGCILVPMQHLADFRIGNYLNASIAFALLAAVGTTGYTLLDDASLRILQGDVLSTIGRTRAAFLYLSLEAWATFIWITLFILASRVRREEARVVWSTQKRIVATTATVAYLSYGLILISYTLASNVGYITAFRQAAIPLGALIGIVYFRESLTVPKSIGILILTVGLVLVALF